MITGLHYTIIKETMDGLGDKDPNEFYPRVKELIRNDPPLLQRRYFSAWLKVHQHSIIDWQRACGAMQ